MSQTPPHYLLGHTPDELQRLDLQGELYRDVTLNAFRDAGIDTGMDVLDIGCGSGDVSITAARVVGDDGSVLGIDRGADAIDAARAQAHRAGITCVQFEQHEIEAFPGGRTFDALIGRFVLMHQPSPAEALRAAARHVRPGGVVVMIESHMDLLRTGGHSTPHVPLYETIVDFKSRVVEGAGADLHAGGRMRETFARAGLPDPHCRLDAGVEGGSESIYYEYVEQSVRSMLPEAQRLGITTFSEAQVAGLGDRLRAETLAVSATLIAWPVVSAWVRLP